MKKQIYYFGFTLVVLFLIVEMTNSSNVSSVKDSIDDKLYKTQFKEKYSIYAVNKPNSINFAGEIVPTSSSEIWERLDNELLRNIYYQSNTLLYFKKANKYFPIIEPILEKYNIPNDFKYLAIIESGLENVISPSGAAGFWQIMKPTAKDYGLEVNSNIDERYNLEMATIAACQYLREAYIQFGSWTAAAASYNMGRNGLSKRMKEQNVSNYYSLYLNSETSRYVFRILAIKEIMKNPREYGYVFRKSDLYSFEEFSSIEIDSTVNNLSDFAKSLNINYKLLKYFNPWMRTNSLPNKSRKKYIVKIPTNSKLIVE